MATSTELFAVIDSNGKRVGTGNLTTERVRNTYGRGYYTETTITADECDCIAIKEDGVWVDFLTLKPVTIVKVTTHKVINLATVDLDALFT